MPRNGVHCLEAAIGGAIGLLLWLTNANASAIAGFIVGFVIGFNIVNIVERLPFGGKQDEH